MDGNALTPQNPEPHTLTAQDHGIRRQALIVEMALFVDDLMADYRKILHADDPVPVEQKAKILTQLCRAVQAAETFISRSGEMEMDEKDASQTSEANGEDPGTSLEFKAADVKRKLTHMARILRPEFYPDLGGRVCDEGPGGIRGTDG